MENRFTLALEDVELSSLVRDVVERHRPESERQGTPVSIRAAAGVTGHWDRLRLDQVVSNLVGNAVKYGRGKPVEVEVEADGGEATLVVRDHGIGISPEDRKRIFGRFERAVSETNYGGFGLGLWITGQIVKALHGRIEVESTVGEGSAFRVVLPLEGRRAA
jgi:signal transduction histidine kinase